MNDLDLMCPECGSALLNWGQELSCAACGFSWTIDNGVPLLCRRSHNSYQADELTPELSGRLVSLAEEHGWQEALRETVVQLSPSRARYLEKYVSDVRRGLHAELLPLSLSHVVLDHGCGWGALTCKVAPSVKRVVAMDLVGARARFTAIRATQAGASNVIPLVAGDTQRLPFPNGCFDVAMVNGVLEWVPSVIPGDPLAVQEQRLSELSRVVRPGGHLLLAIENRYYWRYFLGFPEVHTGMRLASIVPRRLSKLIARWYGEREFRVYTHSLSKYETMLRKAGFTEVASYIAMPEYNFPEIIVPARSIHTLRWGWRAVAPRLFRNFVLSVLLVNAISPHLAYCYMFVARRESL